MYFIRHSERLDKTNPEVWKASTRYLENAMDTPLSENGFKIAEKTILDILKKDKREIGQIYSSPAERCLQTAMEFQKKINEKYGILVPIKIENGLIFDVYNEENFIKKFEKRKVIFGKKFQRIIFVDDYMSPRNIARRFGEEKFDLEYKPFVSIKEINSPNSPEKQFNLRLKTVFDLYENINNGKLNIAVTHQENICDIIAQFSFKLKYNHEVDDFRRKYFEGTDYCFWITITIEKDNIEITKLKNKSGAHKITKKFIESLK